MNDGLMVAALYVERNGAYWNLPGVDPWDEERDAGPNSMRSSTSTTREES